MYIWVGIDVENQLSNVYKQAFKIDQKLRFQNSCFTLPLHISLKMSFYVDDAISDEVITTLECFFQSINPFDIAVKAIEQEKTIVWIRMRENQHLNKIHDTLNHMLMEQFGVGLHEYDEDYKFHTTLFMDQDCIKVTAAYSAIQTIPLPQMLKANRFVIGISHSGALGTYTVIQEVIK